MRIISSAVSETGKVRSVNQDSIYSYGHKNYGVFVVADGMGGHLDGERASRTITEAVRRWSETEPELEKMETPEIIHQLKGVLSEANEQILRMTPPGMICGSTVVILVLIRQECILLTVGDSRCYGLQKGFLKSRFRQMSIDDVVGGEGSQKNRLTNAVGIRRPLAVRCSVMPMKGSYRFLLCSDGIYKYCDEDRIEKILKKANWENTSDLVGEMSAFVERCGARDNYSCFLICAEN